jgi:hypothetical protein
MTQVLTGELPGNAKQHVHKPNSQDAAQKSSNGMVPEQSRSRLAKNIPASTKKILGKEATEERMAQMPCQVPNPSAKALGAKGLTSTANASSTKRPPEPLLKDALEVQTTPASHMNEPTTVNLNNQAFPAPAEPAPPEPLDPTPPRRFFTDSGTQESIRIAEHMSLRSAAMDEFRQRDRLRVEAGEYQRQCRAAAAAAALREKSLPTKSVAPCGDEATRASKGSQVGKSPGVVEEDKAQPSASQDSDYGGGWLDVIPFDLEL